MARLLGQAGGSSQPRRTPRLGSSRADPSSASTHCGDLLPATIGACLDDEQHNPTNGDGLQHTSNGLLVWRKADNVTAFTDGYRTWVNGPRGVQERLNSQRFPWETNPSGLPAAR